MHNKGQRKRLLLIALMQCVCVCDQATRFQGVLRAVCVLFVLGFRFQEVVVITQFQSLLLPPGKVLPICVTQ